MSGLSLQPRKRLKNGAPPRGGLRPVPGSGIVQAVDYRQLQTRPSITGWTPELVGMAADAADSGNLLVLADLVEAMMSDDRIAGVSQTLTLGMLGLPVNFVGGDQELRQQLEGVDGVGGEWDCMHPEAELQKLFNWGMHLGIGLAQRVPLPRIAGQRQRFRLQTWHPRWLSYDFMGVSGSHWRVQTREGQKRVAPGGQWVLYLPFGDQRPWVEGKWRALAFPWLVKRFALEDRANQGEVIGSPTWVGKSNQGSTERQRQRFVTELRALGRNGRIVLPDGWDLDLVEASGLTWEIFSESSNWADQAITIVIAGQTATTEGSPGFDSGKTQDQILASVTRFFAKSFARCLHEQSLQPWAFANTGSRSDAPCGYWNTERLNSQAAQATMFETLGRAVTGLDTALSRVGQRVDSAKVCSNFGIPITSDLGAGPIMAPPVSPKQPEAPPAPKVPQQRRNRSRRERISA